VHKTSVYLPEALKAHLAALSAATRRSEADLIRTAIERLVADGRRPARASAEPAPLAGPRLVGVGVGPGASDLLTTRALQILAGADQVFVPAASEHAVSQAETIVRSAVPGRRIDRLPIAVFGAADERRSSFDRAAEVLIGQLERGASIALALLGDPNVFSSFDELARRVRAGCPHSTVETVPGIMAFQQVAAHASLTLATAGQLLCIGTGEGVDALTTAAADPATTVVLYKGGRQLPALADGLERSGRLDGAVLGELLDRPGERCAPLRDAAEQPASYLTTVVSPATDRPARQP
jgi:precorrin-2/cobalt-factor-2 C20-methyltransferase